MKASSSLVLIAVLASLGAGVAAWYISRDAGRAPKPTVQPIEKAAKEAIKPKTPGDAPTPKVDEKKDLAEKKPAPAKEAAPAPEHAKTAADTKPAAKDEMKVVAKTPPTAEKAKRPEPQAAPAGAVQKNKAARAAGGSARATCFEWAYAPAMSGAERVVGLGPVFGMAGAPAHPTDPGWVCTNWTHRPTLQGLTAVPMGGMSGGPSGPSQGGAAGQ